MHFFIKWRHNQFKELVTLCDRVYLGRVCNTNAKLYDMTIELPFNVTVWWITASEIAGHYRARKTVALYS